MSNVVSEYGKALFSLSHEEQIDNEILGQVRILIGIFDENPEFIKLLSTPTLPKEERMAEVDKVFGDNIHKYLLSFIKLMIKRGHALSIPDALRDFEKRWYESSGIAVANVTSAVPLSEKQKISLLSALEKKTGKDVELVLTVDPYLIGGISVNIDGELYEDTIRRRIDKMKQKLSDKVL